MDLITIQTPKKRRENINKSRDKELTLERIKKKLKTNPLRVHNLYKIERRETVHECNG